MLDKIKKNPRTTLAGIGVILANLLHVFHLATNEQSAAIVGAAAAIGLMMAGDA